MNEYHHKVKGHRLKSGGLYFCYMNVWISFSHNLIFLYSLGKDQIFVCSVLMEQIIMGILIDDFPILYKDDAVVVFNCRQSMCNDKCCPIYREPFQCFLNCFLGLGV